ncbi:MULTISPECIES: hypothetical protein [unclassified Saccharothrix]|uniref:hypothetical protein n=1 Tax=unclassified Saccharothrix TaxID=2593673 RepID=UPI00307E7AA7
MAAYGGVVALPAFGGIRGRSARSRGPALVMAAAVLVAGLGAMAVDEPAAGGQEGSRAQINVSGSTWHMNAE